MSISAVSSVNFKANYTPEFKAKLTTGNVANMASAKELPSLPTSSVLAQMPNISFKGSDFNYGNDNLSSYYDYSGPKPPQVEMNKFYITKQVQADIENEDYLSAIKGKLSLAKICKAQGQNKDAFLLEEGIRRLYKDLPKYQKPEAKDVISAYNPDMAKYIDEDIKNL